MPHLHLSLQAMDDLVLKRMKRRHDRAARLRRCRPGTRGAPRCRFRRRPDRRLSRPRPRRCSRRRSPRSTSSGLTWLHVFPFSPRARHAGSADAAGARPGAAGARRPAARCRRRARAAAFSPAGSARRPRYWLKPQASAAVPGMRQLPSATTRNRGLCCGFAFVPPIPSGYMRRRHRERQSTQADREAGLVAPGSRPRRPAGRRPATNNDRRCSPRHRLCPTRCPTCRPIFRHCRATCRSRHANRRFQRPVPTSSRHRTRRARRCRSRPDPSQSCRRPLRRSRNTPGRHHLT